jgi:hypothetical protein
MVPTLQLAMPAGVEDTVPLPVPVTMTVSSGRSNVAVVLIEPATVSVQGPVPAQAPLQPVKVDPLLAVAVSTTCVPVKYVPQAAATLATLQLTLPLPPLVLALVAFTA